MYLSNWRWWQVFAAFNKLCLSFVSWDGVGRFWRKCQNSKSHPSGTTREVLLLLVSFSSTLSYPFSCFWYCAVDKCFAFKYVATTKHGAFSGEYPRISCVVQVVKLHLKDVDDTFYQASSCIECSITFTIPNCNEILGQREVVLVPEGLYIYLTGLLKNSRHIRMPQYNNPKHFLVSCTIKTFLCWYRPTGWFEEIRKTHMQSFIPWTFSQPAIWVDLSARAPYTARRRWNLIMLHMRWWYSSAVGTGKLPSQLLIHLV